MLTPSYFGGEKIFKEMIYFVRDVLTSFKIGGKYVRVNVVTYMLDIQIQIHSSENQTFESISSALLKIQYEEGSGELFDTLEFLRKKIHDPSFGARPGVPKVIIYITDMIDWISEESREELHKLLISKVTIFAVGGGKDINEKNLQVIAGTSENRIYGKSFTSMSKEKKILPVKICKGEYTRWGSKTFFIQPRRERTRAMKCTLCSTHLFRSSAQLAHRFLEFIWFLI